MASPERSAGEPYAAYNVVAVYRTLDQARDAVTVLNQSGIDAASIEIMDRRSPPLQGATKREADRLSVTRPVVRRAGAGAAIGALLGVIVGLAIHLIFDSGNVVPEIVGALVGLLVGAALG